MSSFKYSLLFPRSKTARNAEKVKSYVKLIAYSRIRHKFNLPLYGEDRKVDEKLEKIVDNFFDYDQKRQNPSSEIDCDEILQWLKSDAVSVNDRKMYLRVSCLTAEKSENRYEESVEPITEAEIKEVRWEFWERFIKERQVLRDSKKHLFDLPVKKLAVYLLPFISVFFLLGGYVNVYFFYRHFGIDTSHFFSLNDYLASSIEELTWSVWILFVCWIAMFYGYPKLGKNAQSENSVAEGKWKRQLLGWIKPLSFFRTEPWRFVFAGFIYLTLIKILHCIFIEKKLQLLGLPAHWEGYILNAAYLIVLASTFYLAFCKFYYFAQKRFKNTLSVEIVLLSIIMFFSSIFFGAYKRIAEIELGLSKNIPRIETEVELNKNNKEISFLGGNHLYIFLLQDQGLNRSVVIIPRSKYNGIVIPNQSYPTTNSYNKFTVDQKAF